MLNSRRSSPGWLVQEDLHDFEYGTSVSSGGLAKGFLSGGTKLMGVEEELEEVGEERVVDVEEEAKAKAVRAKVHRSMKEACCCVRGRS